MIQGVLRKRNKTNESVKSYSSFSLEGKFIVNVFAVAFLFRYPSKGLKSILVTNHVKD